MPGAPPLTETSLTPAPVLEEVGHSPDIMLNGAAVSASGRVFTSFPRWLGATTPGVGEVQPDGTITPYPGDAWNTNDPGVLPAERFLAVHSIHIDRFDRLWVVDEGRPFFPGPEDADARPKLVQFDLATNRAVRIYVLDERAAPPGFNLGHVRCDATYAYVTDPHLGALIVIELASGGARRVLEGQAVTAADPTIVPLVDGRPMLANGKVLTVHVDLVELSPDGMWLYFSALFGPTLYRVPVSSLTDPELDDCGIVASVEAVATIPPVSGLIHGPDGSLYLSALADRAVLRLRPGSRQLETLIADQRLDSPNEGSVGKDGYLYVPASQANRMPVFNDGVARMEPPYIIYRVKLPQS